MQMHVSSWPEPRNRSETDVVGASDPLSVSPAVRRASASRLCSVVNFGLRPSFTPRALARSRPSEVRVRIRSRSTSARPPSTAIIRRPVAVEVSAHGSASDRNCALRSTIDFTIANKSKVERVAKFVIYVRSLMMQGPKVRSRRLEETRV